MKPECEESLSNFAYNCKLRHYAMARDYYRLEFLDESVDVTPIVPALAAGPDERFHSIYSDMP